MATELHCWFDFEDGNTCFLPDGHDGDHERTPDEDIIVSFVETTDGNN